MIGLSGVVFARAQAAAEYVAVTQVGWTARQVFRDTWLLIRSNPEQSAIIIGAVVFATLLWLRFASSR